MKWMKVGRAWSHFITSFEQHCTILNEIEQGLITLDCAWVRANKDWFVVNCKWKFSRDEQELTALNESEQYFGQRLNGFSFSHHLLKFTKELIFDMKDYRFHWWGYKVSQTLGLHFSRYFVPCLNPHDIYLFMYAPKHHWTVDEPLPNFLRMSSQYHFGSIFNMVGLQLIVSCQIWDGADWWKDFPGELPCNSKLFNRLVT